MTPRSSSANTQSCSTSLSKFPFWICLKTDSIDVSLLLNFSISTI
ncbi:unnamed protein product [Brassica oleracea var. botrytis]